MRKAFGRCLLVALAAAFVGLAASSAMAEDAMSEDKGLSERMIRVIQSIAWDRMPSKLDYKGRVIELDKSDPKKFWLPDDDARRIIAASDRSATATLCDLKEAARANFITMMNLEQAKDKWTREQLHMIKWVYLTVQEVRTAKRSQTKVKSSAEAAQVAQNEDLHMRSDFDCTAELKQNVEQEIVDYVKMAHANEKK